MNIEALAAAVGVVNILFLAFNTSMVLNIKLAITELKAEIEKNRREDGNEVREWVEQRLAQHCQQCTGFKPHSRGHNT